MWSDAMGQGEKAYPFVCPECGEEVRGNERHFSIQPLLNRIMLTIEGNRTSIGEELERFITVYASFGAEFLSSPLQTVQCETAKPERAQLTSLKISMESLRILLNCSDEARWSILHDYPSLYRFA